MLHQLMEQRCLPMVVKADHSHRVHLQIRKLNCVRPKNSLI